MIDYIAVTNPIGETLVMPMTDPYSSGFAIKTIDGLGPAKGSVNVTDVSSSDGAIFNSSRVGTRNIVLTLEFVDDYTVGRTIEDCRILSYRYFPVKKQITFIVKTDRRYAYAIGYVESNEPNIFSSAERATISILCPDSFFYSLDENDYDSVEFSDVTGGFEFAFEDPKVTSPTLKFSDLSSFPERNLYYKGDSDIGVKIHIHALGPAVNPRIVKTVERTSMTLITSRIATITNSTGILAGDDIDIDTRRGRKRVTLTRDGVEYNIINALGKRTNWLMLRPGDNLFSYTADSGSSSLTLSIDCTAAYSGV